MVGIQVGVGLVSKFTAVKRTQQGYSDTGVKGKQVSIRINVPQRPSHQTSFLLH